MPPDFLNSREDAILFCVNALVAYASYSSAKSNVGLGASFVGVVRAFFTPKLLLLFGSAAGYTALLVLAAERVRLWHTTALKETIYWFVLTGVVLVGDAVTAKPDENLLRRILRRALRFTLIVEFVVNLYVFPLLVEIVLVFLTLAFVMVQAYAPYDPKVNATTRKFIDNVLLAIGVFLLMTFAVRALTDLDGFLSRDTTERFLVAPVLSLAFIPFLFIVAWYCQRELAALRRELGFN